MGVSYIVASSDSLGVEGRTYGVTKFSDHIRKQWALTVSTPHCLDVAAYFRSEEHARQFAATFALNLKDFPQETP